MTPNSAVSHEFTRKMIIIITLSAITKEFVVWEFVAPSYGYKEIGMKCAVNNLTKWIMNQDDQRQLVCKDVSALWALVFHRFMINNPDKDRIEPNCFLQGRFQRFILGKSTTVYNDLYNFQNSSKKT